MFKKKYSKVKNETTATNSSSSNEINEMNEFKENKCKFSRSACYLLILGIITLIISIIIVEYFANKNFKNNGSLTSNNNNNNTSLYIFNTTNKSLPKNVWRNPNILENENDPLRNTIHGKYMVFFNLKCMDEQKLLNRDVIDEFLKLWKCYKLNQNVKDDFPNITDHWIYIENIDNCHQEDDVEIIWNDYCIFAVEEDEIGIFSANTCKVRTASPQELNRHIDHHNLWTSSEASGSYGLPMFHYVEYDANYNPNMDIIVMDSGIDATHSQFTDVTIERIYDPYPGEPLFYHGTAVASVLIGKDYGSFRADTENIKLLDVRITNSGGNSTLSRYINGLDAIRNRLRQNRGRKYIINLSVGFRNPIDKTNTMIGWRLLSITNAGGIVFAAAGNSNEDVDNHVPARSDYAITVGGITPLGTRWADSNYGSKVDIWAPSMAYQAAPNERTAIGHGTSYAAPLVAGIAANILANNPNLNRFAIKERLLKYAIYDVADGLGNTDLPRVQALCKEYCQDNGCIDGSEEVLPNARTGGLGIEDGVSHFRHCEGDTAIYSCPTHKELYLEECWYGRPANDIGNGICLHRATGICPQQQMNCRTYIEGQCNDQQSCLITIDNINMRGDPCRGIYKYGGIAMRCIIPTPQVTGYEGAYNLGFEEVYEFTAFEICENEQATFSCNPGYLLSLDDCEYGSPIDDIGYEKLCPRDDEFDVTACPFQALSCRTYIGGRCNNRRSCTITINNHNMGGDPCRRQQIKKFAFIAMKCIEQ